MLSAYVHWSPACMLCHSNLPGLSHHGCLLAQVRTQDDVMTCARHMHTDSLAPIFLTSSVTGQGLDLVRTFYNLLPQRHQWCVRMQSSCPPTNSLLELLSVL